LWGKDAAGDVAGAAWITRFDRPIPGRPGGPLAGLRFAVKDNMDVAGW
jgi:allophanate hydrolase